MTWRTSKGDRVLAGAEAELIRAAIDHLRFFIDDDVEFSDGSEPDSFPSGVQQFDRLLPRSQLALLAEVGYGLLVVTSSYPSRNALNEATIAVLFHHIETEIQCEIDNGGCHWRELVSTALVESGGSIRVDPESVDHREWNTAVQVLSDRILWDNDYLDESMLDLPPDEAKQRRDALQIEDDYYTAVPPDPDDAQLSVIRGTLNLLLSRTPE